MTSEKKMNYTKRSKTNRVKKTLIRGYKILVEGLN
jgi:hypothetical protein